MSLPDLTTTRYIEALSKVGDPPKSRVEFSQGTFDAICRDIAEGKSLRVACQPKDRPNTSSVMRWLAEPENAALREQYARAREAQAEHYVDEIISIIDTEPDVARARVRMDGRKWVSSKLVPKKYGDKVLNEHAGPDGTPLTINVTFPED